MLRSSLLAVAVLTVSFLADVATADPTAQDVSSVFHVAKSENKNQVHYAIHLDASCAPAGPAPMVAYWRMLEHGPQATEPLLDREVGAYGFAEQRVLDRNPEGGRVLVRLRALPSRTIVVQTSRRSGACAATATTTIGAESATLDSVYVKLRWPFGVDHMVLVGRALSDGRTVEQRIAP